MRRLPKYDKGKNDNKGIIVLPEKYFAEVSQKAISNQFTSSAQQTSSGSWLILDHVLPENLLAKICAAKGQTEDEVLELCSPVYPYRHW